MPTLGPDEKICPMCAETVKAAAVRCRYCGHDFSGRAPIVPARPDAPSSREKMADAVGGTMMKFGLVALAIVGLVAWCSSGNETPEAAAPPASTAPAPASIDGATRRECTKMLAQAERLGVVRAIDPGAMRLTVDEPAWRELGPVGRRSLMAYAACDWFGVGLSDIGFDRRVTIIGWQSGKRIASSMGGAYTGD